MKRNTCTLVFGMLLAGLAPDAFGLPVTAQNPSSDLPPVVIPGEGPLADTPWKSATTRFDPRIEAPAQYGNEPDLLAPNQTLAHAWHRAAPGRTDHPLRVDSAALLPIDNFPAIAPRDDVQGEFAVTGSLAEPATLTLLALGLCCLLLRERLAAWGARAYRSPVAPAAHHRALVPALAHDAAPFVLTPADRPARSFPPRRRRAGTKSTLRQNLSSVSRDSETRSRAHKSTSALEKAAALRRARTSAATRPAGPRSARHGAPCRE